MLGLTITAVVLALVYPILLTLVVNHVAEKLAKSSSEDEKDITIGISDSFILFIRNNTPCGKIEWSEITDINEGKAGFFLTIKENEVLILAKNAVTSGTYEEAVQVINLKKNAIKKES